MHRRTPLAAALDTASVVLFVAIGRREHEQDSAISGLVSTAAPFLIALVVAWLVLRVWRRPTDWRIGVGVWAIVVTAGMVLRRAAFDDGTALSFVIVASCFLASTLIGWRLLAGLRDRARPSTRALSSSR
jgi:hypothetical protein